MTSCPVVRLLVLLISLAAVESLSKWDADNCLEYIFNCKCELVSGLKTMTCTNKNLTLTPVNGFFLPEGTQVADLSNNLFHVLRDHAFNQYYPHSLGLDELLKLNLSRNEIQRIAVDAFKYIDNLTTLDLSYNKIDRLTPLTFRNMSKLKELHLHHNLIKNLEEFTFKGLDNLKVLDLSYGRLSKISWWAFFFSRHPTILNLEHNNLTTFHSNYIFSPATFDGGIRLTNNPIVCDCKLHRFYEDSYAIVGRFNLTCSYPYELRGLQLTSLVPNDFHNCTLDFIVDTLNETVEAIASTTTELTCKTIPGPLFKNWTIVSKADGQNVSVWPDRFTETRSATWVNLTITNIQKSDEGEYKCSVYERVHGSMRAVMQTFTLVVNEQDFSPMILNATMGGELVYNDTSSVHMGTTDDEPKQWLVLGITGILVLFFAVVMFVVVRNILRDRKSFPEGASEPLARDSHMYEDVDLMLARLANRALPPRPCHDYAVPTTVRPVSIQYLQHSMAVRSPFALPAASVSTLDQSEEDMRGSYDNELYLRPVTSQSQGQLHVDNNRNNLTYIPMLPTYKRIHRSDNKT